MMMHSRKQHVRWSTSDLFRLALLQSKAVKEPKLLLGRLTSGVCIHLIGPLKLLLWHPKVGHVL